MIRLAMMLVAALVVSTAADRAYAKTAMQTFPVQAGAGAHDVYPGRTVRSGLPRNPLESWAGSIPEPAGRI